MHGYPSGLLEVSQMFRDWPVVLEQAGLEAAATGP